MGRDGLQKINQGIGLTPNEQGPIGSNPRIDLGLCWYQRWSNSVDREWQQNHGCQWYIWLRTKSQPVPGGIISRNSDGKRQAAYQNLGQLSCRSGKAQVLVQIRKPRGKPSAHSKNRLVCAQSAHIQVFLQKINSVFQQQIDKSSQYG